MGRYSDNISSKKAKTLVINKKHSVFSKFVDKKMDFWFRHGDKTLHYGRGHLEGSLKLNKKGLSFYKKVLWN